MYNEDKKKIVEKLEGDRMQNTVASLNCWVKTHLYASTVISVSCMKTNFICLCVWIWKLMNDLIYLTYPCLLSKPKQGKRKAPRRCPTDMPCLHFFASHYRCPQTTIF